ncbi:MAG: OmpA family protein [Pseudomonadota bacterium]
MILRAVLACLLMAQPLAALELALPATASQTAERNTGPDIYRAPLAPFVGQGVPVLAIEGDVRRSAWRIGSPGITPLQVMRPLRAQLVAAGFDIVLDCDAAACGGFDFRFGIETLPGPNMYVNIRAFHFVTALKGPSEAPEEVVSVLASTSATQAYVQIIQAGALAQEKLEVAATADLPVTAAAVAPDDLAAQLLAKGHVVLSDLEFGTGSAELSAGPYVTLSDLAAFLRAQPDVRVALVGHTDAVGSLEGNIALSKRRAEAVRQRMIDALGVPPARMDAEGMGYLAPVASNLDAAGRERNRRVEVILLSAE